MDIVTFLATAGIADSKGDARKLVQGGGISINRKKVADIAFSINESLLLHQQFILAQKGKKNYYLIKIN
jgi:tyrosyl-tRNA synthetase